MGPWRPAIRLCLCLSVWKKSTPARLIRILAETQSCSMRELSLRIRRSNFDSSIRPEIATSSDSHLQIVSSSIMGIFWRLYVLSSLSISSLDMPRFRRCDLNEVVDSWVELGVGGADTDGLIGNPLEYPWCSSILKCTGTSRSEVSAANARRNESLLCSSTWSWVGSCYNYD